MASSKSASQGRRIRSEADFSPSALSIFIRLPFNKGAAGKGLVNPKPSFEHS
jgi:hypothetical protein